MKLGIFTALFQQWPLEQALDYVKAAGVEAVELGVGAYPGNHHCNAAALLEDRSKAEALRRAVESRGLIISALSAHGNPLHPQKEIAGPHHQALVDAIKLAPRLGVSRVNCFSGCPGDHEGARYPNWVTCPWPPDFLAILEWQWNEKLIPYWREQAKLARENGVVLCFEMHPGFPVYNPETLLKLRNAVGEEIAANFDPSHLFWQGIDPLVAIRALKGAIGHVHAKDTALDSFNIRRDGVLDTKNYGNIPERAWVFRTVGYGHDLLFWREMVSTLRANGYDFVMSIEHEDGLASIEEGFQKAVTNLKQVLLSEPPPKMWWA